MRPSDRARVQARAMYEMGTAIPHIARLVGFSERTVHRWMADPEPEPRPLKPVTDTSWKDDALCAEVGGDMWYAERGEDYFIREAKEICRSCPVGPKYADTTDRFGRQRRVLADYGPCLEYALAHDEAYGVWGGHAPRERHALKKQNRRTA